MSRGFVTIATGKDNYYRIAANLLDSYRLHSADPMPFALICDRKNRYSDKFDMTVIIDEPTFSYVDKLRLPEFIPFDETIFIDADCLAYMDLNSFWDMFRGAGEFSAFGKNYPLDYEYGWFKKEEVGSYSEKVKYIPDFIGGVYYLRKGEKLNEFYSLERHILDTFHDYTFRQFTEPADEPVFALAMAVCGFKTAGESSPDICFYPHTTFFESNMEKGTVRFDDIYQKDRGVIPSAFMVHWGSGNTKSPVYLKDEYRLKVRAAGKKVSAAGMAAATTGIYCYHVARKIYGKLKKMVKG